MAQAFHRLFYMSAAHPATWAHRNTEVERWSQILELKLVNAAEVQIRGLLLDHSCIMAVAKFQGQNTLIF